MCLWCLCVCGLYIFQISEVFVCGVLCLWSVSISDLRDLFVLYMCVCGVYLLRYTRSLFVVSVCSWSVSVLYI